MGCADARMPSDTSVDGPPVTSLPKSPQAVTASNVITEWVAIVQPAIHNADAPRPPASSEVLQATAMLAIYDAVMAIEGGFEPFAATIEPSWFRPDGPDPLTSDAYTADFIEARDYGRATGTFRTPEQTDIAYFWSEHSFVHWNRNLIQLVADYGLTVRETARLLAMVYTASADALIAGFEAKYFYTFWRPRTAIPRADTDGNPDTDPDPTWAPLLTVNHPRGGSGLFRNEQGHMDHCDQHLCGAAAGEGGADLS
jgi:hypothetical protein